MFRVVHWRYRNSTCILGDTNTKYLMFGSEPGTFGKKLLANVKNHKENDTTSRLEPKKKVVRRNISGRTQLYSIIQHCAVYCKHCTVHCWMRCAARCALPSICWVIVCISGCPVVDSTLLGSADWSMWRFDGRGANVSELLPAALSRDPRAWSWMWFGS